MKKNYHPKNDSVTRVSSVCPRGKTLLAFLLLSIGIFNSAVAQDCNMIDTNILNYPPGTVEAPTGEFILPAVRLGVLTTYTLPINAVEPYNATLDAVSGSCDIIANNHFIGISAGLLSVKIDKRCPVDNEDHFLYFTLNVTKDGCTPESKNFIIQVYRDSLKMVLALDISGSMGAMVDGGGSRIDELKKAVNLLVPKLEAFQQDGDSIGLSYFSSEVYQPDIAYFPKELIKITDLNEPDINEYASERVRLDLLLRNPMQMTAMGNGLLDARRKLLNFNTPGSNTTKTVFLFTDGLQNWGPLVNIDGNTLTGVAETLNTMSNHPPDSIRYYTIGTWGAGMTIPILTAIADASGGKMAFVIDPANSLSDWFDNQLTEILKTGSPQVVFRRSLPSLTTTAVIPLHINRNVSRILVQVSTENIDSIGITLHKGEIDILADKMISSGTRSKILIVNIPDENGVLADATGEWEIVLTGTTAKGVSISAFVDDHYLSYDCTTDKNLYTSGDEMIIEGVMKYAGRPLFNETSSVQAIIMKPGDDLGHLLSIYQTPASDTTVDSPDPANEKFQALLASDSTFYNALLPEERIVNLVPDSTGRFHGKFTDTGMTGVYNLIFLLETEVPGFGKIVRTTMSSTYFKFGQVVPETPEVTDVQNAAAPADTSGRGKARDISITIRPKNKFKYYMGPGFAQVIGTQIRGKDKKAAVNASLMPSGTTADSHVRKMTDNLDGSYTIEVANVPRYANPAISISIWGEDLYSGPVIPIPLWAKLLIGLLLLLLILAFRVRSQNQKLYKALIIIATAIILLLLIFRPELWTWIF